MLIHFFSGSNDTQHAVVPLAAGPVPAPPCSHPPAALAGVSADLRRSFQK